MDGLPAVDTVGPAQSDLRHCQCTEDHGRHEGIGYHFGAVRSATGVVALAVFHMSLGTTGPWLESVSNLGKDKRSGGVRLAHHWRKATLSSL